MAKKNQEATKEEVLMEEEDLMDMLDGALATTEDTSLDAPVSEEELSEMLADEDMEADAVDTVVKPRGRSVSGGKPKKPAEKAAEEEIQPALTATSRRSFKERQQQDEEILAARNLRQEEAVLVGGYINAKQRKTTMEGRIAGVVAMDGRVFWTIYDGPVTVYIPFREALPTMVMDDLAGDGHVLRQKQMLAKSIGATIPFSVEEIIPGDGEYFVYGSRKIAMQRVQNRYFGAHAENPVKVGDTLIGQFLAVGNHAAWVNVNGLDIRLTKEQLSHRYLELLPAHYHPGDSIRLRVQRLDVKDGKVDIMLSARPCELENCKARHNRLSKGDRYIATMTSHRVMSGINPKTQKKEPYYVASMWLEDVNVPGFATLATHRDQEIAHSGDRVLVEVEKIAKSGYVRCRILKALS